MTKQNNSPAKVQPGEPMSLLGLLKNMGEGLLPTRVWVTSKQLHHPKVSVSWKLKHKQSHYVLGHDVLCFMCLSVCLPACKLVCAPRSRRASGNQKRALDPLGAGVYRWL